MRDDRDSSRLTFGPPLIVLLALSLWSVLAPAGSAWAQGQTAPLPSPPATRDRQLVVPFENASGAARLYWLGEASAVLLTDDLTALGAAALPREERLIAFERLRVPVSAVLTHATAIRIGELVGAG